MSAKYGLRQEDAPLLLPTPINVPKRVAWFLGELVKAGPAGVTTIDYPGVRVGDCILKLRKAGIDVQTIYEPHDGEFAGRHGRYVLRSRVELLVTIARQMSRRAPAPLLTSWCLHERR
jgi:hypothetical protein